MEWREILEYIVIPFMAWALYEVRQTRKSIEMLNVNTARIIERQEHHEYRLVRLEEKLD